MKSLRERLDEILEDPVSSGWSSTRVYLTAVLTVFLLISTCDSEFRDPGAFVTIILALLTALVAPKVLDLRMAIGKAAATIGSRFTRREETVTVEEESEEEPVDEDAEEPKVRRPDAGGE